MRRVRLNGLTAVPEDRWSPGVKSIHRSFLFYGIMYISNRENWSLLQSPTTKTALNRTLIGTVIF